MKIGIDIRALMEGKITGVETYQINLLHALFRLDHKHQYVLFANSWKKLALPRFDYPNVSLRITKYPNKFFNLAQKFLNYPKIDRLLGGLDLFFSPHWRTTALSRDLPVIMTFHDLFFELVPGFFNLRRRLWHWFMNYKQAARRADKIIAVSESTKQDLINIYETRADKITVIHSGVTPAKLTTGNLQPKNYFLYFGTFEPRKNIDAVLAAYKEYAETSAQKRPLILAGSSGWKTRVNIPKRLKEKIIIHKNVSEQNKIRLYEQAFALIFPSFYEGFGFPILEAASAGVPVIASYNTSLAEIGKDFVLFVNPLRSSQIATAMRTLETDEKFYAGLKQKGLTASRHFTWEKAAQKTLQLFEEANL